MKITELKVGDKVSIHADTDPATVSRIDLETGVVLLTLSDGYQGWECSERRDGHIGNDGHWGSLEFAPGYGPKRENAKLYDNYKFL
jgi:hypothetical protein